MAPTGLAFTQKLEIEMQVLVRMHPTWGLGRGIFCQFHFLPKKGGQFFHYFQKSLKFGIQNFQTASQLILVAMIFQTRMVSMADDP